MREPDTDLAVRIDVPLEPGVASDAFLEEVVEALAQRGLRFEPAPEGRVTQAGRPVGRVLGWDPGKAVRLEWRSADWKPEATVNLEIRFDPLPSGTRISLSFHGWGAPLGDLAPELAGWFAREVAAPLLEATAPAALGDWVTDRRARRPSGQAARRIYRDPLFHRPNFKLLLHTLALTPEDYLLEVGCGGGAFLHEALESGCRAAAIDHSPDMARLAREVNREAVREGRFEVVEADAHRIPYSDARFTCAATTGVFGFVSDPRAALSEIRRVLVPGGRFVLFTGTRELAGTPAAPEPMASRIRFYEDDELRNLAQEAGFIDVQVTRPSLGSFAREAGLSEDEVALFNRMGGAQFLTARKA